MKRLLLYWVVAIVTTVVLLFVFNKDEQKVTANRFSFSKVDTPISDSLLSYFINAATQKAKQIHPNYNKLGLDGGVDGFVLREVFNRLTPSDFVGVQGREGDYSVDKGDLFFTGNASTTSAVLTRDGFRVLLRNCSKRLQMLLTGRREVDLVLTLLLGRDKSTIQS